MTTLDVLKSVQRLMTEKLIGRSEISIIVNSRPWRSELSVIIQNSNFEILAYEMFMDDRDVDFRSENEKAYKRIMDAVTKHSNVSMAG